MRPIFLVLSSIGIAGLSACSGENRVAFAPPASVPTTPSSSFAAAGSVPQLAGAWAWTATGRLTVPESQVEIVFGIPAEGPVTHLRCDSSGTLQLSQTGSAFAGLASRTTARCETGGGRVFVPPSTAFPPVLPVADGTIRGRAVQFLLGQVAGLGCPHHGAIVDLDDATAVEFRASGRCIIPGHPQSPVPVEPPPLGTSHDTSFIAARQ